MKPFYLMNSEEQKSFQDNLKKVLDERKSTDKDLVKSLANLADLLAKKVGLKNNKK
jgi:hypothetical protein